MLFAQFLEMGPDFESDHARWAVGKVELLGFRIHVLPMTQASLINRLDDENSFKLN